MASLTDEEKVDPDIANTETSDIFDLSDEDFLKLEESKLTDPIIDPDKTDIETDDKTDDTDNDEIIPDTETEEKDDDTDNESDVGDVADTGDEGTDEKIADTGKTDEESGEDESDLEKEEVKSEEIDKAVEFDKILAPFKANGVQIQAKTAEEAISLMQMGANYHKKMAGLKPSLKILKLLEKNDLLDPEKINYLIDLNSKDPAAITKLLKESKIDPTEIDVEADTNYKPKARSVSDNEVEIDNVLDAIKDSPTYDRTLSVLTDTWDETSRKIIGANPHIINVINEQMGDGIFDAINEVVVREKSFGRLQGMSDLEAYKQVGDAMSNKQLLPGQTPHKATPTKTPSKKTAESIAAKKKSKKAAGPVKTGKAAEPVILNPLAMSDEEISKITDKQLGLI